MDVGGLSPDDYTKLNDVKPTDLWILVLGGSGAGKSRFINAVVSEEVETAHGLNPGTRNIRIYACDSLCEYRVWFVDTVALDRNGASEAEIIFNLAQFLTYKCMRTISFTAVLWFYVMTARRYQGSSRDALKLLERIVGVSAFPNLTFVTTGWDLLEDVALVQQRAEDVTRIIWKFFLNNGATVHALTGSDYDTSSRLLASKIVGKHRQGSCQLYIQEQLIERKVPFCYTEVGATLYSNVQEQRRRYVGDLLQVSWDKETTLEPTVHRALRERINLIDTTIANYLSPEVWFAQGDLSSDNLEPHQASGTQLRGAKTAFLDQHAERRTEHASLEPVNAGSISSKPIVPANDVYQDVSRHDIADSGRERDLYTHLETSEQNHRLQESSGATTSEIIIAVMGITGSGKSTFIQLFTQDIVPISSGIESYTKEITIYRCSTSSMPKFFLIDTPGFDDTYRSDADILRQLADFLSTMWSSKVMLAGILYMHSIMDPRFSSATDRNLGMFKKLCGDQAMSSVVLVTTFWDVVEVPTGAQREHELRSNELYWAGMIRHGSRTFRQDNGKISGTQVLQHIIGRRRHLVLSLQEELVNQGKSLPQTGAGQVVARQLIELRHEYEAELAKLREQHRQALQLRDAAWHQKIEVMKKHYEDGISRQSQNVGSIAATDTDKMGHQFDTSNVSGNARAVFGNVTNSTQQTFYISNATLVFGDKGGFRGLKRPRRDSEDSNIERERIKSILREFLST